MFELFDAGGQIGRGPCRARRRAAHAPHPSETGPLAAAQPDRAAYRAGGVLNPLRGPPHGGDRGDVGLLVARSRDPLTQPTQGT